MSTKNGFTLIELLVSLTILVIVITAVYSSFSLGLKAYRQQEKENYQNQNLRQSLRLISRDLRCACVCADKNIKFTGSKDKVVFSTYLPESYYKLGAITQVSYYVDNQNGLIREIPQFSKLLEVAPLVKNIRLKYFDGKTWFDAWNTADNTQANLLPCSVEIQVDLSLGENPNEVKTYTTLTPVICK